MERGSAGLQDSADVVVGEIEEEEILPAHRADFGRGRSALRGPALGIFRRIGAGRGRLSREGMLLEFGQGDGSSVIRDGEILPRQVADGVSFLIGDLDVDELEDDGDLVLKGLDGGLACLGGRGAGPARRGRSAALDEQHCQDPAQG